MKSPVKQYMLWLPVHFHCLERIPICTYIYFCTHIAVDKCIFFFIKYLHTYNRHITSVYIKLYWLSQQANKLLFPKTIFYENRCGFVFRTDFCTQSIASAQMVTPARTPTDLQSLHGSRVVRYYIPLRERNGARRPYTVSYRSSTVTYLCTYCYVHPCPLRTN